uniref:Protein Vpu n=1 Tax=Human immunodeficiency virus type 1 TaxID=11676 RepID=I6QNW5_HV1|nr:vpu protein [Human immunodeficiency virus 1]
MQTLTILAIAALVVAAIIAIIVWTIVLIEYRKILKQRRIDRLIEKIRERTEDSGNESEGDMAGIINTGVDMEHFGLLDVNNM